MKNKKIRIKKISLLHALKNSSSISQVAAKFGRQDDGAEEYIWEKIMKMIPEAAHFLSRNESIYEMKLAKVNKKMLRLKEIRLQLIESTCSLMNASLIKNKPTQEDVKKFLLV